jgi:hypothetical protein
VRYVEVREHFQLDDLVGHVQKRLGIHRATRCYHSLAVNDKLLGPLRPWGARQYESHHPISNARYRAPASDVGCALSAGAAARLRRLLVNLPNLDQREL